MTTPNYNLFNEQDREDRRKHLELVSGIVSRQASASTVAKGWSITIAGAAYGVAAVRDSWYLFVLGIVVLVVFSVLDSLYLHNERKFRDLYDEIADNNVPPFSMNLGSLAPRSKNKSYLSWSVLGFYLPLVVAGCVLLSFALAAPTPVDQVDGSCQSHVHSGQ